MSPYFKGLSSDQHALSMAYAVPIFSHLSASSKIVCNKRETRTSRAYSRPLLFPAIVVMCVCVAAN